MKRVLLLCLMTICVLATWAYDFEQSGVFYNFGSAKGTCLVTYENYESPDYNTNGSYSGEVYIPEKVSYGDNEYTVIGLDSYAFCQCEDLTSVTIAENSAFTSFGYGAFYECTALKAVNIPAAVKEIPNYAFYNCLELEFVDIPENSVITSFGDYSFWQCTSLKEILIPNNTTNLGSYAFQYCTSMTDVKFKGSVTSWGLRTFNVCTSLASIDIPEGTTVIGQYAFASCYGLASAKIGRDVKTIDDYAFGWCSGLQSLEFDEDSQCTTIGQFTFYECEELGNVTFPDNISSIGVYCFQECNAFTDITLPSSLTSLTQAVLYGCKGLMRLTLSAKISTIQVLALSGCTALQEIFSYNSYPPTVGNLAFNNVPKECVIYIPVGSYNRYSTASLWADFINFVEMVPFSVETLDATNVTDMSATLNGNVTEAYDAPGSIKEKGFEYWTDLSDTQSVVVEGDEMAYTLENLASETTYTYRVYAVTEEGTTYGEEKSFSTVAAGITTIENEVDMVDDIYTIGGQKIGSTQKGLNIIRYSNGETKKILNK